MTRAGTVEIMILAAMVTEEVAQVAAVVQGMARAGVEMEEAVRIVGRVAEVAPVETVRRCNRTPRSKRGVSCLIVAFVATFASAFGIMAVVTFCASRGGMGLGVTITPGTAP
jgi:hypothetical protein